MFQRHNMPASQRKSSKDLVQSTKDSYARNVPAVARTGVRVTAAATAGVAATYGGVWLALATWRAFKRRTLRRLLKDVVPALEKVRYLLCCPDDVDDGSGHLCTSVLPYHGMSCCRRCERPLSVSDLSDIL